ncbi:MAG: GAF domain-containing protein [Planctomycetaceae bacterium]|nr:GAF domain-containing protein [Planctomycetaceae bacterium]
MPHNFYEKNIKTFPVENTETEHESPLFLSSLPELSQAFLKVTGYHLRFARPGTPLRECYVTFPIKAGKDSPVYMMGVARNLTSVSLLPERDVETLARAIADLICESYQWQSALRQREAELAANVQLTFHDQKNYGLAQQLETILRNGAKACHCDAAALYLLDHETSLLKLRSIWGLPEERLIEPPRQLYSTLADLEAMLGHAVILHDDDFIVERWNPPDNFNTSVCVPVSSSTTIHGTIWFFSNSRLDFDSVALNLLEIVAGRIAIELERKMLLREGYDGMILKRQLTDAEHFMRNQLPHSKVKSGESWQIAGTISHPQPLAATFYDWQNISPEKTLITLVSTAENIPSVESQMRMVMLQTEIKNLPRYKHSDRQIIQELEDIAFAQQAEKKPFEMMFAILDKAKSQLRLSCGGSFVLFRFQNVLEPTMECIGNNADFQVTPLTTFARAKSSQHPTIQRMDHDFDDMKPELSEFRILRLQAQEGIVAVHFAKDSHHRNDKILNALFSPPFLQEKISPALSGNALQIAELFASHIQEAVSGANITVLVVKNSP